MRTATIMLSEAAAARAAALAAPPEALARELGREAELGRGLARDDEAGGAVRAAAALATAAVRLGVRGVLRIRADAMVRLE